MTRGAWSRVSATALVTALACTAPGGPGSEHDREWTTPAADAGAGAAPVTPTGPPTPQARGVCQPPRASERLPPHVKVITREADAPAPASVAKPYFVTELFATFKDRCGACHVSSGQGNFKVTWETFARDMDRARVLGALKSDDPAKVMPPLATGGVVASARRPSDPIVELIKRLELWYAQGQPADVFYGAATAPPQAAEETAASYRVSEAVSAQLSNLGSCIPDRGMVASAAPTMDRLDAFFAAADKLPDTLAETDLVSLDGAVQAQHGLIAFAPTYPLYSDGSAKIRHVRVPRGQAIRFDKATQRFAIPPNTRFYKTFLKKVVDVEGHESYRKIETRLIVSRPDELLPDGKAKVKALFGAYAWNEDETEARLVDDDLNDRTPFADRVVTYVTDEPKAEEIRASMPANLSYALGEQHPGLVRRYAIPGRERCLECHMGADNASFVLGFTPLQINRRPLGEGGVYEPAGADELNQLQRFIDYGLISGITSAADVLPLEATQGARKPRNEYELRAQAYLIGNCSSCHNPRGFPSQNEKDLATALDFLPSPSGGIFQFPLERTSPLRRRGVNQDVEIPYITPSLRDVPKQNTPTSIWKPKWTECAEGDGDPFCDKGKKRQFIDAPWRSLIYRNVDAPFIYTEDYTIFPHMPRHSFGFDCRAPRLLAEWMVSIPARRKNPRISEDAVEIDPEFDREAQPYVEVKPGEPGYAQVAREADERLARYHNGKRFAFCPDTTDIVDHDVLDNVGNDKDRLVPQDANIYRDELKTKMVMPEDGVPDKPHFVATDLTDSPGQWLPRNPNWETGLVTSAPHPDTELDVPALLRDVVITDDFRKFALSPVPMGLWRTKPGCSFSGAATIAATPAAARPRWMSGDPATPVYAQTPGEAVYQQICVNCHGPRADAKGLLGAAVAEMTGGTARVANFRDGLFGPVASPGANIRRVFADFAARQPAGATKVSAEDWAARYLAWMALGGTRAVIPQSILNIVGTTPVVGERPYQSPVGTPNMLEVAQKLCTGTLPAYETGGTDVDWDIVEFFNQGDILWDQLGSGLIKKNGHAELWLRLCSHGNRPIVRALVARKDEGVWRGRIDKTRSFYFGTPQSFPAGTPVMNQRGEVVRGLAPDNLFPLCLQKPEDPQAAAEVDIALAGQRIPFCPPELFAKDAAGQPRWLLRHKVIDERYVYPDIERWAARGAINAGLAVFLYLGELESCRLQPTPAFNRCEQLGQAATCANH